MKRFSKGSVTVEATLVVPIVIMTVFAVLYMCMMLYEHVYLYSIASDTAVRGAAVWVSPGKDMFIEQISKENIAAAPLYWRILDWGKDDKKKKIEQYTNYRMNYNSVLAKKIQGENGKMYVSGDRTISIDIVDYVVYKKLVVNVKQAYSVPISGVLRPFGLVNSENKIVLNSKAEAVINEPVEFIRNVDFLADTVVEIDDKTGGHLEELKKNVTNVMSKFSGKLKGFLNK